MNKRNKFFICNIHLCKCFIYIIHTQIQYTLIQYHFECMVQLKVAPIFNIIYLFIKIILETYIL
jgi:hypothetical protein